MKYNLRLRIGALALTAMAFMGAVFNPHRIISDEDMTDFTRMSLAGVQSFLTRQGGILANYRTTDVDGVNRSAAEIIYNTSYKYRLNPQFLLATLQKESSVVTGHNQNLVDWAAGFGVCDGCSKDSPNVIKYKGFAKQVNAAADRIRNYYLADLDAKNSTISGWGVGVTKTTLDGLAITPENKATAVLYTYTPWVGYHAGDPSVGGNSLFFDIMERFFPNRSISLLDYPNLSLFQNTGDGSVYKLEEGLLRPITSQTALLANYNASQIIQVDSAVIDKYEQGDPITFPRFILVQGPSGGVFLIDSDHKRRAITSAEVFKNLGYNPAEVIPISQADLDLMGENPPITAQDKYPLGAVLQNSTTGAIMYLDDHKQLHPIWSKEILTNRFQGYPIYAETEANLAEYEQDDPIAFEDGTLLKIPERDTIYVIDDGKRRPVSSVAVIDKLGGFDRLVNTSKDLLKLYPKGDPLTLKKKDDSKQTKKEHKNKTGDKKKTSSND